MGEHFYSNEYLNPLKGTIVFVITQYFRLQRYDWNHSAVS